MNARIEATVKSDGDVVEFAYQIYDINGNKIAANKSYCGIGFVLGYGNWRAYADDLRYRIAGAEALAALVEAYESELNVIREQNARLGYCLKRGRKLDELKTRIDALYSSDQYIPTQGFQL